MESYEQKYKQALKEVQELYKVMRIKSSTDALNTVIALKEIFPELAESEEEKIRKAIISGLKYLETELGWDAVGNVDILDAYAWLEKQGEQKPFDYENATIVQKDFAPKQSEKPRYSIGDVLCDKSCTTLDKNAQPNFEIVDIRNGIYICDKGSFPISQQDEYELVAKKIEQKEIEREDEEYNGEDYGIDSLYHAIRILEKTLGEVEGYQSDDGILEHKCAITAVKKLYKEKPAEWSEEDEEMVNKIIDYMKPMPIFFESTKGKSGKEYTKEFVKETIKWLKSLKERINI